MKFSYGIRTKRGTTRSHVLKLMKNLHGQKQEGRVWFQHLAFKLRDIDFQQSAIDECVFYRRNFVFIFYVHDNIFTSSDPKEIDKAIQELKDAGLDLEDQGNIADYLGINFNYGKDGTITMPQPQLMRRL